MNVSRSSRLAVGFLGCSLILAGLTACSESNAASAGSSQSIASGDGSETNDGREVGPDGKLLPPGVKAPEEPAKPGAARLGPDGHYDYSAPDFVLGDPCEDQELMGRLAAEGWELGTSQLSRFSTPYMRGCSLTKSNFLAEPLTIVSIRDSESGFASNGSLISVDSIEDVSWIQASPQSDLGEMCVAVQETHSGATGFLYTFSEFSEFNTADNACQFVSSKFKRFFGGKK